MSSTAVDIQESRTGVVTSCAVISIPFQHHMTHEYWLRKVQIRLVIFFVILNSGNCRIVLVINVLILTLFDVRYQQIVQIMARNRYYSIAVHWKPCEKGHMLCQFFDFCFNLRLEFVGIAFQFFFGSVFGLFQLEPRGKQIRVTNYVLIIASGGP